MTTHIHYIVPWAKKMLGRSLTAAENDTFKLVNAAYVHTTENTGVVVPTSVAQGIIETAAGLYPMFGAINRTMIRGNVTLIVEKTSSDASWYDEATPTADGKEDFREVNLTGCELARQIKVSWKLRAMSVEDFIPYIIRKMAFKMGQGLGYGVSQGKGKPGGTDTFKPEPLGVITALKAESGTPQIVTYTAGGLTYKNITAARAKVASVYTKGLALYANSKTMWEELANVVDGNGRPIFITNVITENGVGRVLGSEAREDDSLKDGEILFANMGDGYEENVNSDVSIQQFEDPDNRLTKHVGYAIVDGAPIDHKAFALLTTPPTP